MPAAARKIRDLIADWWQNVPDRREIGYIAIEALLLSLLLGAACRRGIRRTRRSEETADPPPFWRRASAAAALVVFRALPVVVPVVFLYGMIANTQNLPERIDWLFYFTAQSLVIVFTVWALAGAVFSPSAPHWRLVPTSDAAAARLHSLFMLLAVVYSLTTFLYVATRLIQAPFALTIAIALPSSLLMAGLVVALLADAARRGERRRAAAAVQTCPHDCVDHCRRDCRQRGRRLSAAGALSGAATGRHRIDPRPHLSSAGLGGRFRARLERRRHDCRRMARAQRRIGAGAARTTRSADQPVLEIRSAGALGAADHAAMGLYRAGHSRMVLAAVFRSAHRQHRGYLRRAVGFDTGVWGRLRGGPAVSGLA